MYIGTYGNACAYCRLLLFAVCILPPRAEITLLMSIGHHEKCARKKSSGISLNLKNIKHSEG